MTAQITDAQRRALEHLAPYLERETYLAGGVAVGLHLEHRPSRDLDLFLPTSDPTDRLEALAQEPLIQTTSRAPGTVYLRVEKIPVSLIRYRYPLLSPPVQVPEIAIPVAALEDLICMKLSAIGNRGALRDFWDLHAMMVSRSLSLAEALSLYTEKYAREDMGHVVRSLVYFADAAAEPFPPTLSSSHWESVKDDFQRWVKRLEHDPPP